MSKSAWLAGMGLAILASPMPAQPRANGPAIVFFDWGERDVRRDDQEILNQVAEQWKAQERTRLVLSGHSDKSGPSWANVRGSRQRAEAVEDYLVTHGVPRSAITIQAFGEQEPVVDTEDGVREVQNRRVEIRFVAAP